MDGVVWEFLQLASSSQVVAMENVKLMKNAMMDPKSLMMDAALHAKLRMDTSAKKILKAYLTAVFRVFVEMVNLIPGLKNVMMDLLEETMDV